jgi:hypothetical protein
MKKLLVFCLLLTGSARGQNWKSPLPTDSATHTVTYGGVIEVPGAKKSELYSRAREWYTTNFGSAKAVLEMDDREDGKLIGKGFAKFGFGKPIDWAMWRTVKIEVKDEKYRYTITDFILGGPATTPDSGMHPIEAWLASTIKKGKEPGKAVTSVLDGIQSTTNNEVTSLNKAMRKDVGRDW